MKIVEPLVSVGIPNYNQGCFIKNCINSLINQTYKNIEILISDNSSTDDSLEILESIMDSRIKIRVNEENIGVYPNWDRLFYMAKGKYFKHGSNNPNV